VRIRHRHIEIAVVVIALCLAIWALVRSSAAIDLLGLGAATIGYVAADFLCGTIYWLCDEIVDPSWPIVGTAFITPFRDHHENPTALPGHDLAELCGNDAIVTSAILAAVLPCARFAMQRSASSRSGSASSRLMVMGVRKLRRSARQERSRWQKM